MGEHLLIVTVMTLFMFFWIEIFQTWYKKFLSKRGMSEKRVRSMLRILWVILALVFWYTLLHRGMPTEFTITHFSYTLFIFSLYGLLRSLYIKEKK